MKFVVQNDCPGPVRYNYKRAQNVEDCEQDDRISWSGIPLEVCRKFLDSERPFEHPVHGDEEDQDANLNSGVHDESDELVICHFDGDLILARVLCQDVNHYRDDITGENHGDKENSHDQDPSIRRLKQLHGVTKAASGKGCEQGEHFRDDNDECGVGEALTLELELEGKEL